MALGALLAACTVPASVLRSKSTPSKLIALPGGATTVGIDSPVRGCNPNAGPGSNWGSRLVLAAVLPSAFLVGPDGQAQADTAVVESAELVSTSPQTVVYTLNPRAVWSDGTPISAADFVYAWRSQRGPHAATPPASPPSATPASTAAAAATRPAPGGATLDAARRGTPDSVATSPSPATIDTLGYRDITSVASSSDGQVVTVVFRQPFADWKMLFDNLLPAHIMTTVGWDPSCPTLDPAIDLSGGPFEIASATASQIVLAENPQWWGPQPDLGQITVRVASGPAQLARWLVAGTIDVADPRGFDPAFLEALGSHPAISTKIGISSTFLQLEFSSVSPWTSSISVRLALAHAIDRQGLVNAVVGWADSAISPATSHLYSQGQPSYPATTLPPGAPNALVADNEPAPANWGSAPWPAPEPFPLVASDVSTAHLMTASGFQADPGGTWHVPAGPVLSLTLAVDSADPWVTATAPLMAAQLHKAGFVVRTKQFSGASAAGAALASGQADMALVPIHGDPYPSASLARYTPVLGTPGKGGSRDWSNLNDPAVTDLLQQAATQLNPVDAVPTYAKADQLLWNDMFDLPLFAEPMAVAWSTSIKGVVPNPYGPGLLWSPGSWEAQAPTAPGRSG